MLLYLLYICKYIYISPAYRLQLLSCIRFIIKNFGENLNFAIMKIMDNFLQHTGNNKLFLNGFNKLYYCFYTIRFQIVETLIKK